MLMMGASYHNYDIQKTNNLKNPYIAPIHISRLLNPAYTRSEISQDGDLCHQMDSQIKIKPTCIADLVKPVED